MTWLQEKYALLVAPKYRNFSEKGRGNFLVEFSCPICGDSATNTHKARGYIYARDDELHYKCHNCGWANFFTKFLKDYEPDTFKAYWAEHKATTTRKKAVPRVRKVGNKTADQLAARKADPERILLPLVSGCVDYLESRSVPDYGDFRYIDDMRKLAPFVSGEQRLLDEGRLALPVRNVAGELVGLSCRSLHPTGVGIRYINVKFGNEELIYNANAVDPSRTIYVTEGVLDSKFLPNAIATLGSDLDKAARFFEKRALVLIFDNQYDNPHISAKVEKAIKAGFRVVIWPKAFDAYGKDINEMVLAGAKISEIINTIEEYTIAGAKALKRLKERKTS
ncbi:hypothetical protein [Aureimonas altamirensis]|uniref:hypothetical protein n=1 Tax=Aureimonas altamirensis TaxID=370622 RepID=UPI00301AFCF7